MFFLGLIWLLVQLQFLFWVKHWMTAKFVFYWPENINKQQWSKTDIDFYFPHAEQKSLAPNQQPMKKENVISFVLDTENKYDFAISIPFTHAKTVYQVVNQKLETQIVFWLFSQLLLLFCT